MAVQRRTLKTRSAHSDDTRLPDSIAYLFDGVVFFIKVRLEMVTAGRLQIIGFGVWFDNYSRFSTNNWVRLQGDIFNNAGYG